MPSWLGNLLAALVGLLEKLVPSFLAWRAGQQGERAKQAEDTLHAVREAEEVRDRVARLDDSDRRKRLREWER